MSVTNAAFTFWLQFVCYYFARRGRLNGVQVQLLPQRRTVLRAFQQDGRRTSVGRPTAGGDVVLESAGPAEGEAHQRRRASVRRVDARHHPAAASHVRDAV